MRALVDRMIMPPRPSEPLLQLLRDVARKKGLNTAALAKAADIPRGRLKHVLSGSEPLTVDELIALSQALEISAGDMAGLPTELPSADAVDEEPTGPEAVPLRRGGAALATLDDGPPPIEVNPYGNHAEQMLMLGFGLGCDIHVVLDGSQLEGTGIPTATLERFPERLPLHLEAAYHRHHDPRFLPESIQLTLSFDALYTCSLPWAAFQQVTLFPLPPEPPEAPEPESAQEPVPPPSGRRTSHLRLVE
ncbi:MAG: helix-turn-helix transcriptional regulator [Myxococcota bacterium]|nr:helix-turn-helix transcriptional regulator [Myxococcota bacterium]